MDRVPDQVVTILAVDDDEDDRLLLSEALFDTGFPHRLEFAGDGEELVAYLDRTGRFAEEGAAPAPSLILLDLRMPRINGFEVLERIKVRPEWRRTPVVVMTSSWSEADIRRAYDLGANSFLIKPVVYDQLVEMMRAVCGYWLQVCELPVAGRD